MHIELRRTFLKLLQKEQGGDAGALYPGNATLTLPALLDEPRAVILSEAGSGKTEEICEAARQLRKDGKASFFLRLEPKVSGSPAVKAVASKKLPAAEPPSSVTERAVAC